MRSIKQIKNLKNKKVLVRVDFNVPILDGQILDDFRITKSLPTIKFLEKKGAKIILITHLGKDGTDDLTPVKEHFFKVSKCSKERVSFFENIRKFPGETKNELNFARELAKLGDIYINEAFSVSHREHASIVLLPKFLPSYMGFNLEAEIKNLAKVFKKPKHPLLFILGGAKFSTKMPLIKKYLKLADYLFIGGALMNDFLKAEGYEIGKSLVDDKDYGIKKFVGNKKIILPKDVIVKNDTFSAMAGNVSLKNKKIEEVEKDETILDIGSESIKDLEKLIKKSKMILWNGPLGKYENKKAEATRKILKSIAKSKTESIIGGGDIVSVLSEMKMQDKFTFVSTGGGATLEYLAKGTLPGIKALQ